MNNDIDNKAKAYLMQTLEWYDKKSILYKRWYTTLIVLNIITSALIPFVTLFMDIFSITRYIVALMGSIVTIISTFKATFGFHEKWVWYRSTTEILRYHKYLFETECAPYKGEDKNQLLVSNVYSIVNKENRKWKSVELNIKETSHEN